MINQDTKESPYTILARLVESRTRKIVNLEKARESKRQVEISLEKKNLEITSLLDELAVVEQSMKEVSGRL
jgi:hypothetical protein